MWRAYQSPCSGSHCGPQWAQMPNFAFRNHSGAWYCCSDSQVGANLPAAIGSAAVLTMAGGTALVGSEATSHAGARKASRPVGRRKTDNFIAGVGEFPRMM